MELDLMLLNIVGVFFIYAIVSSVWEWVKEHQDGVAVAIGGTVALALYGALIFIAAKILLIVLSLVFA